MIEVRSLATLGTTVTARLNARHHFSFAGYLDRERERWGSLAVVNHNVLACGAELPPQPLDNVEVLQWVRRGVVGHTGSFGSQHRTTAGEVQVISTGAGISYGDMNRGRCDAEYIEVRLFSYPQGGEPTRRLTEFPSRNVPGEWVILASEFAEDREAIALRARARIIAVRISQGSTLTYRLAVGQRAYLLPATGMIDVGGHIAGKGDGVAIQGEPLVTITGRKGCELMLIDCP